MMKLIKKTATVLLSFAVAFTIITTPVSAAYQSDSDILALLGELKIMNGDPDGNLRLNDLVSRAEFAKIAAVASTFRNSVASNLAVSPFRDVPHTHWAAPYIKAAVSNHILSGYPDGSFCPENPVLYEEAMTVVLKLLGYTDDDFGDSWPYGQVGMADRLELTKNIARGIGEELNRHDVAVLLYNLLDTKPKGGAKKYISDFDCEILENVTLIASTRDDPSINTDQILASTGTYRIKDGFPYDYVGRKGDLVIKNGDEFVSFAPYEQGVNQYTVSDIVGSDLVFDGKILDIDENLQIYYKSQKMTYQNAVTVAEEGDTLTTYAAADGTVEYAVLKRGSGADVTLQDLDTYMVYSTLDGEIVVYQNGGFQKLDILNSTTAYKDKARTTYAAVKSELEMGDMIYVKWDSNHKIEYISVEKGDITGPVTVRSSDWQQEFGTIDQVMRNGVKASPSDIQINDILYYFHSMGIVLAYSNKITGVYENALPNRDMPAKIVVSGVTYELESVAAFNAVCSSGTFRYGDTVTLLLGKTNQVADVVSTAQDRESTAIYGYLAETGQKEFTASDLSRYTVLYAKVVQPGGQVLEYNTAKDYAMLKNSVVKVTFANGTAALSSVKNSINLSGGFDWTGHMIGGRRLADDVKILDVTTTNRDEASMYTNVFPQRLNGLSISSTDVLYGEINSNNEVSALILRDVTGDAYQYGIVKQASTNKSFANDKEFLVSGSIVYDINGVTGAVIAQGKSFSVAGGQPARFVIGKTGVDSIRPLTRLDSKINKVTAQYLLAEGNQFPISDRVVVYVKTYDYNYMIIPLSDITQDNQYKITAYYDKPAVDGGQIRILLAEK